MCVLKHEIRAGLGLGNLLLGFNEHEVRDRIGEPNTVNEEDFGDGLITRTWEYEALGLSLTFSEDDDHG